MPTCVTHCRKPHLAGSLDLMISWGLFQALEFCDFVAFGGVRLGVLLRSVLRQTDTVCPQTHKIESGNKDFWRTLCQTDLTTSLGQTSQHLLLLVMWPLWEEHGSCLAFPTCYGNMVPRKHLMPAKLFFLLLLDLQGKHYKIYMTETCRWTSFAVCIGTANAWQLATSYMS